MTDASTTNRTETGNGLVCFTVDAEPVFPRGRVQPNPLFVTQMIASAAEPMPQRRRADRVGPIAAYTPYPAYRGRTCRIV